MLIAELLLPVVFGYIVGLSLGLTGGGGSIFAIPLLMYGLGLGMTEAVPVSIIAVALTAAVGAWYSYRAGLLIWQPIFMFASGGVIGAPVGIYLARYFEASMLIISFSILALVIGIIMWIKSMTHPDESRAVWALTAQDDKEPFCKLSADGKLRITTPCTLVLLLGGVTTGILSGLFGVGGGFIIVPVLMFVIELGIHRAVAASLVIITCIGVSVSLNSILSGDLPWNLLLPFIIGSITGLLSGRLIAAKIAGPLLQRVFAIAIVATGTGMLLKTVLS